MPGIAGIIGPEEDTEAVRDCNAMVRAMMHEPFYDDSNSLDEGPSGLRVGSVRLGNERDGGGLYHTPDGLVSLVLSGDLFSSQFLSPHWEVEDFVQRFRKNGPSALRELNGLFAGVFVNRETKNVFLFTDRFGMGRVYWHKDGDRTYFASEAKCILRVLPELRQFDAEGLGEYLKFGCVLNWRTLFRGVHVLPAGTCLVFSGGDHRSTVHYYKIEEQEPEQRVESSVLAAEIAETCKVVFPRYMDGGEELGISLTGGLDTRLLMACGDWDRKSFPAYTFAEVGRDTLDVKVARKVADDCRQTFNVLRLAEDFLGRFEEHSERTVYITDGTVDVLGSHEIYLNRLARELAPIRLTGNYGSEILRGMSTFNPNPINLSFLDGELQKKVLEADQTFQSLKPLSPPAFALLREIPWKLYGLFCAGKSQLAVRCPYLDNDLTGLALRKAASGQVDNDVVIQAVKILSPRLASIVSDRGISSGRNPSWLEPLIRFYYEYLFKVEYHLDDGLPSSLAKILGKAWPMRMVEKMFLGKHKFLHYRGWFRDNLSDYFHEILHDDNVLSDPCFESNGLRVIVGQHLAGNSNNLYDINRILTLRAIRRTLLSGSFENRN